MKKIVIYYFSGTKNTEIITKLIEQEFVKQDCQVTLYKIEDILRERQKVTTDQYNLIGIGCPITGYTTPNLVNQFIKLLPHTSSKDVFVFRTAGGVAEINYNASKPLIRKLIKKGYPVFYERIFSISSNWIKRFDDEVIKLLYEASSKKISISCKEILERKKRLYKTGLMLKIGMEITGFFISKVLRFAGKDMKVKNSCTSCGLCVKNCPVGNIKMKERKVRFGLSCNSCMRCVYSCPKEAIYYRHLSFFPIKGGYNIINILEHIQKENKPITYEPPFLRKYIDNDDF